MSAQKGQPRCRGWQLSRSCNGPVSHLQTARQRSAKRYEKELQAYGVASMLASLFNDRVSEVRKMANCQM